MSLVASASAVVVTARSALLCPSASFSCNHHVFCAHLPQHPCVSAAGVMSALEASRDSLAKRVEGLVSDPQSI